MKYSLLVLSSLAAANAQSSIDNAPFADSLTTELYSISDSDNECTSSLGVSMAMSLVYPSAISDSEVQLRTTFGYPADMQSTLLWQDTTTKLTERYQGNCYNEFGGECGGTEPSLQIANSVFVDDDVVLNTTYAAVVGEMVQQLDFASPDAGATVNTWVEESTNGLIDSIVPEGDLSQWIVLAINSIYLKASWVRQFNEQKTNEDMFLSSPDPTPAHFMNNVDSYPYSHEIEALPGYQILQHYFSGDYNSGSGGLSMIFVLPPPGTDNMASSEDVLGAIPNLQMTRMAFSLPKFRFESTYEDSLIEALQKIGVEAVFDRERADNLCIQQDRCDAYIDTIIQKTVIDVNEKGVEAAAVTAIGISATSLPPPTGVLFLANRPFQFFLYDEVDNVVIFEGVVSNPGIVEGSVAPLQASHSDEDFWSANFGITATVPELPATTPETVSEPATTETPVQETPTEETPVEEAPAAETAAPEETPATADTTEAPAELSGGTSGASAMDLAKGALIGLMAVLAL